jgi:ParB/RepB/Spo0J family partition protein
MTTRKETNVRIADLRPHPQQSALFNDPDPDELEAFAASLKRRGQDEPIHITPDKVIIAGHRRVAAAKRLGWETIKAVVRHDLAELGDAAIEEFAIVSNLDRRHMTPLERARCIKRVKDLIVGRKLTYKDKEFSAYHDSLRDQVGALLGISGRHIDRYLAVLNAPPPIQAAFEARKITLVEAAYAGAVHDGIQRKIVAEIDGGILPKEVMTRHMHRLRDRGSPSAVYAKLVTTLAKSLDALASKVEQILPPGEDVEERIAVLQKGIDLINRLIERELSAEPERAAIRQQFSAMKEKVRAETSAQVVPNA